MQCTDRMTFRNQNETLTQNYRRLGLTSRLNSATGGIEKLRVGNESKSSTTSKLAITNAIPKTIAPREARVQRDPETGKILRVIHAYKKPNPLNDPLNSDSEDDGMADDGEEFEGFEGEGEPKEKNEIVRQLEEQALMEAEKIPRKQSEREREWIERLVAKHGDDYERMARDMRLNPMQQTAADIRKRVGKWKAAGGSVSLEG
jgi:nucleolar protein 16